MLKLVKLTEEDGDLLAKNTELVLGVFPMNSMRDPQPRATHTRPVSSSTEKSR